MHNQYCQSCGMPMTGGEDLYGTEANGAKSEDYCKFCYAGGAFTSEMSMQEMIEFCVPHMVQGNPALNEEQARSMMQGMFPQLKRWQ